MATVKSRLDGTNNLASKALYFGDYNVHLFVAIEAAFDTTAERFCWHRCQG